MMKLLTVILLLGTLLLLAQHQSEDSVRTDTVVYMMVNGDVICRIPRVTIFPKNDVSTPREIYLLFDDQSLSKFLTYARTVTDSTTKKQIFDNRYITDNQRVTMEKLRMVLEGNRNGKTE